MVNEQFWNIQELGKVKTEISEFIANNEIFQELDATKKHELEKGIYALIDSVKEPVFRAVEREYFREDVVSKIKEYYGKKGEILSELLPLDWIDTVVDCWQNDLSDADLYWEANWDCLFNVMKDTVWLMSLDHFSQRKIRQYGAYLKEWFFEHGEGEPVCIKEFFDCEMQNEDVRKQNNGIQSGRSEGYNGEFMQ